MNWKGYFGPVAAILLVTGVVTLALLVPGYDPIRQTVSEIGEAGSPMERAFTLLLSSVAACLLVFATSIRDASRAAGHSTLSAWFVGIMAISVAGVGLFSFPHPLHTVFGLSELIGYQAPLVLAFTWRKERSALVRVSWLMAVLVWVALVLNLATLDRQGVLFTFERPFYGLIQRALFLAWFGWCAIVGTMLARRR
jgi:hypothetical membrane protein